LYECVASCGRALEELVGDREALFERWTVGLVPVGGGDANGLEMHPFSPEYQLVRPDLSS
jgi:hypothetical protein